MIYVHVLAALKAFIEIGNLEASHGEICQVYTGYPGTAGKCIFEAVEAMRLS